ncbi:uncharacterized protein LOC132641501 [Lycium barbarum]|uniref:uncharacterized protein LOC132641501 n=1 Tax=Lycium barbarum TaxID=112863 RepID=UPI00293F46C9|nr:uncharacterized protein LOC132641501 [Lycium barbarum]
MAGQRWNPPRRPMENTGANQYQPKKGELYFRYCKKIGYEKDQCYKLVGYPQHYKVNKQGRNNYQQGNYGNQQGNYGNQQANMAEANDLVNTWKEANNISNLLANQGYSKEQYKQITYLFKNAQGGNSNASNSELNAAANMAGPFPEEGSSFW